MAEHDNDWELDVDITNRERKRFRAEFKQATEADEEELLYPWFARFIKRWPYEGDPTDAKTYLDLKLSEWVEAQKRVTAAFQRLAGAS